MPVPKTYRVTSNAENDLKQIGRYTERVWGKAQRNKYLKALERCFSWLAGNPMAGKHRADVEAGYYSFPQGQHVIFYVLHDQGIDIIGVPHKEMDVLSYFDE